MVLPSSVSRAEYTGNGTTTVFPYGFVIFDTSHLEVLTGQAGEVPEPASGFTITGVNSYDGGTVVFNSAPAAGTLIVIRRVVPIVQETDFRNQARFFAETHERTFDYSRMVDQQLADGLGSSLQRVSDDFAWDAKGARIANVGTGVDAMDAVNLEQVTNAIAAAADEVAQASIARDNALSDRIDAKAAAIQAEEAARIAADQNLQDQISGGGPLEASAFSPISWHKQVIENSVAIPENVNAWSFGPEMAIAEGQEVTIGDGSYWTIANGEVHQ